MKDLFKLDDDYTVIIEPWVVLIPEFNAIIKADRGSPSDYRGDKKLKAKRQLAFIYFMVDFRSKILDWDYDERKLEAFRYTSLTDKELTEEVWGAFNYYAEMQHRMSRSLKTLEIVKKSLDKLDDYFKNIDFSKVDKQGKLLNSTKEYMANITSLDEAYTSVDNFEKRVYEELKKDADAGIRGRNSRIGGKEGTRGDWNEGGKPKKSDRNMIDIAELASTATERFVNDYVEDEEIMEDESNGVS